MRIAIANDNKENVIILQHIIEKISDHEVAWTAFDGADAVNKCANDTPDLILMDMVMPILDGVAACHAIMQNTPCAIIIVTSSVTENAAMIFEAMGYGALDVVKTPFTNINSSTSETDDLLKKIKTVANLIDSDTSKNNIRCDNNILVNNKDKKLVVIGSSTGGPGVLATILGSMPGDFSVPIIIVQHVDSTFTQSFASWLDKQSKLEVKIAREGDIPKAGLVLIAGESEHLVMLDGGKLSYTPDPKELVYKPSVNVFFNSVAKHWKGSIIAGLLTGMGKDGAEGLANIRNVGGNTITQTQETCAVYGMPKAADDIGASMQSLPPDEISAEIIKLVSGK